METLNNLSRVLQGLILAGLALRVVICMIKLTHEEEEQARYKKRIRNCAIATVISQLIFVIKDLLVGYLGSGY